MQVKEKDLTIFIFHFIVTLFKARNYCRVQQFQTTWVTKNIKQNNKGWKQTSPICFHVHSRARELPQCSGKQSEACWISSLGVLLYGSCTQEDKHTGVLANKTHKKSCWSKERIHRLTCTLLTQNCKSFNLFYHDHKSNTGIMMGSGTKKGVCFSDKVVDCI